jgi:acyl-CoA thioesterase FadM
VSGFSWPARVYWEDTDGGGIVYYANYLRFLERARTEWLRAQPEGAASLRFMQRIYRTGPALARGHNLLVEANVRVACVDARTLRPKRLPEFLLEALSAQGVAHG